MSDVSTRSGALPAETGVAFSALREEGIEIIRKLGSSQWTDYNATDPGITLLEQVCFAITDLSYRLSHEIGDLLAPAPGEDGTHQLFTAREILTSDPITIRDYRKLLIDIPGVKNAWLEPVAEDRFNYDSVGHRLRYGTGDQVTAIAPRGLYHVLIARDRNYPKGIEAAVLAEARNRLERNRGLGLRFEDIRVLPMEGITLHAEIDTDHRTDVDHLLARICFEVARHISPGVPAVDLATARKRGLSSDDLFQGPPLDHGFILDEDLAATPRRTALHCSDILHIIMDIPGVVGVNGHALSSHLSPEPRSWSLSLDPDYIAELALPTERFQPEGSPFEPSDYALHFTKRGIPCAVDWDRFGAELGRLRAEAVSATHAAEDLPVPFGRYRSLADYESIQNHLPAVYGVGANDLPQSASLARKGKARQLEAYLLLFDQVLADYHAQLERARSLLACKGRDVTAPTTWTQLVDSLGSLDALLVAGRAEYAAVLSNQAEDEATRRARTGRLMDHLLARLGESFTDLELLRYDLTPGEVPAMRRLADQAAFLEAAPRHGARRGTALSLIDAEADNVAGLEHRIAALLGIRDHHWRILAGSGEEGFHLVEHLLLLPDPPPDLTALLGDIAGFAAVTDNASRTLCQVVGHGLSDGDRVVISASPGYDGTWPIADATADSFTIGSTFSAGGTGKWVAESAVPDVIFDLSRPISGFSSASVQEHTVCASTAHGLLAGEAVEIFHTHGYNGPATVVSVTADSFVIDKPFDADETGAWVRADQPRDPFSNQITFVFPEGVGRFGDLRFRKLVEEILIAETPAHLTPYLLWLDQVTLTGFETNYRSFLKKTTAGEDASLERNALIRVLEIGRPPTASLADAIGEMVIEHDFFVALNRAS